MGGLIIGPKGATLQKLRAQSGAYIEVPKDAMEPCANVIGRPENVAEAKRLILEILYPKKNRDEDKEPQGTRVKFPVKKEAYGRIIGKKGATLKKLQQEFNVRIVLPHQGDSSNIVEVFGEIDNIQNAVKRIHELASAKQNFGGNNSQKRRNQQSNRPTSNTSKPIPQRTTNTL